MVVAFTLTLGQDVFPLLETWAGLSRRSRPYLRRCRHRPRGAADPNKAARLVVKEKGLDVQADPKNATKSKGEKMIALAEVLESWLMNKIEDERLANLDEGE